MAKVRDNLAKAVPVAANENQRKMLEAYVKHFDKGDINDFKESQKAWVLDQGPAVETNIGFIENYRDPLNQRAEFEGFVAVVDKEMSKKYATLVNEATSYLQKLPWNDPAFTKFKPEQGTPFEREVFIRPDYTALEVLTFCSSGVPAGINLPNQYDIREQVGFKNVSLANVIGAQAPKERFTFLDDDDQDIYYNWRIPSFGPQVAAHELLGHGSLKQFSVDEKGVKNFDESKVVDPISGKPITTWYKPGETYQSVFQSLSSTFEECRAEAVGLVLTTTSELQSIFGLVGEDAEKSMYVNWLNMCRAGLLGLEFYSPERKSHGQAHMQARYCLLKVMLEASKGNGFVKLVRDQNNDLVVKLDQSQIRTVGLRAVGDFLLKIGVYKATANIAAAKEMYDRYSAVDEEWLVIRKEVLEKKKPRRQFVQAMTKLSADGKTVELVEFETTREGLVESMLARFATQQ